MKFAKYWSDVTVLVDRSDFGRDKISIWGASNDSQDEAIINANKRANYFKGIISQGFDKLQEYEYFNGFIQEEVVEEIIGTSGNSCGVMTRNAYGAMIINSESVFFGDIDVIESGFFSRILEFFGRAKKDKAYYLNKVEEFQNNNNEYTIKVYETFAGLRIVITNMVFDSHSKLAYSIFNALEVDPLYVKLCKSQSCFRARISPKPWRIGMERPESRFPRNKSSDISSFKQWLKNYEKASKGFRVVREMAMFGNGRPHPDVEDLLLAHDKYACSGDDILA